MRIESLSQGSSAASAETARSGQLARAAQEFEAQMMKELLKPMTGQDTLADMQDDGTGGVGILSEFSSEALAQAISKQGGFGIADRILKELSRSAHGTHGGNAAGDQQQKSATSGFND